jgi:glycosyltransferase involved in cell wall biosynthesis
VRELGIVGSVRFVGWRSDLPAVMSECDLFILPRPDAPMEGFGLAVVEAQLAGLRLLVSAGIADDPLLPSASFRRLSLSEGPAMWARAAAMLLDALRPSRKDALDELARSAMNLDFALRDLLRLHAE